MSEILDTAKEQFSKLPTWGWFAIGGGFLLVVFLSKNKSRTITQVPSYEFSGDANQAEKKIGESEMANKLQQLQDSLYKDFQMGFNTQSEEFKKTLSEREQAYKDERDMMNASWSERINALLSSFNERTTALQNQLDSTSQALNDANSRPSYDPSYWELSSVFGQNKTNDLYGRDYKESQVLETKISDIVAENRRLGLTDDAEEIHRYLARRRLGEV